MRVTKMQRWCIAGGLLLAASQITCRASAATETVLYAFTGEKGFQPGPLILDKAGNLEGTAIGGGKFVDDGGGTFFKLVHPAPGETVWTPRVLYNFSTRRGYEPVGAVIHSDKADYGVATFGGKKGGGIIYKMSQTGNETVVYNFNRRHTRRSNASFPNGLTADGLGNFYGLTEAGGEYGAGVIFKYSADGGYSTVVSFAYNYQDFYYGSDLLISKSGAIYGVGYAGKDNGFVFKVVDGKMKKFYVFSGGADGGFPSGPLIEDASGNIYGTTATGSGTHTAGVIFKLTPDGTESVLYAFTGGNDGYTPLTGVIADPQGNLYGVASAGGAGGNGTVFKVAPDGTETTLHAFTGGSDGRQPEAPLVLAPDGTLFGATSRGGPADAGVVFSITQNVLPRTF